MAPANGKGVFSMEGKRLTQGSVPFFGLGFDLSEVVVRAGAMHLHRHGVRPAASRPRDGRPVPVSGYGLLISLSREIRGR